MATHTEVDKIIRQLISMGWRVERGKHFKCFPPDKSLSMVTIGTTLSDHRALKNIRSYLKKRGVIIN